MKLEKAKRPQGENIKAQMSKLGDTIYEAYQVELLKGMETYFVPNSILTAIRRELIDELTKANQKQLDKSLWGGWDRTLFNNGFGFSQPGVHRRYSHGRDHERTDCGNCGSHADNCGGNRGQVMSSKGVICLIITKL